LQSILQQAIGAAISAPRSMSKLEERQYEREVAAENRRAEMIYQLGRAEMEALEKKKRSCTHSRDQLGNACSKNHPAAVWTTQGIVQENSQQVVILCLRCASTIAIPLTPQLRQAAQDNEHSLLGIPFPEETETSKIVVAG
jgi:hypothetical protein